ncbi:multimeric flavodoxin WrbA [Sinobaca qinghaiensis]|uniref:Multimeric flavodoxin WrbA n=1 Tax=Sinobaca qinghaiensis TaxID=342944 RepID=A0A419V033_9BACL|nr:NAD(P)H-dependent oxidoreductase [Sinobaca qinghaiensis]RKD71304.1 multimeric flavodoxin WrbA [Sinobaca qinghaiensis]
MKISVIYGSTAPLENIEVLTRYVIEGKSNVTEVHLREYHMKSRDQMHQSGEKDEYIQVIDQIIGSEVLILAMPMYCYGMSGLMKTFVDRWPQVDEEDPSKHFMKAMRGKQVYLIITGKDDPRKKALPIIQQFKYICRAAKMDFNGYLIGEAVNPGDIEKDKEVINQARALNKLLDKKQQSDELTS